MTIIIEAFFKHHKYKINVLPTYHQTNFKVIICFIHLDFHKNIFRVSIPYTRGPNPDKSVRYSFAKGMFLTEKLDVLKLRRGTSLLITELVWKKNAVTTPKEWSIIPMYSWQYFHLPIQYMLPLYMILIRSNYLKELINLEKAIKLNSLSQQN